jgi:protein-S-isoprenylcysteine O-methyltransferase Ste14
LRPAVLHEAWATIAFWATLGITTIYDFVISARNRVAEEHRADRGQVPLTIASIGAITGAVLVSTNLHSLDLPGNRWWPAVAGLIIAWAGFAVRVWAVRTLGEYFTKTLRVREGQPVIDSGPYAFVRHPSYTGLLTTMLGFGIALGNWLSILLALGITTVAFAIRISSEEKLLCGELGARYEAYAATHKRLIPGVW